MSATIRPAIYRFAHSRIVKIFFLVYLVLCLMTLVSAYATPMDMFTQSISDMTMPALGLSVFSGIYVGGEFKNRTIQLQISHGQKRARLLLVSFLTLAFVFLLLVFLNAGLPSLIFSLQHGSFGVLPDKADFTGYTQYLLRLIGPCTLFTLARSMGLFILPFIFRDTVKTMLSSVAYSFIVSSLTQRNRLVFPYRYYSPVEITASVDVIIVLISILAIVVAFLAAYLCFRRSALK